MRGLPRVFIIFRGQTGLTKFWHNDFNFDKIRQFSTFFRLIYEGKCRMLSNDRHKKARPAVDKAGGTLYNRL